MSYRLDTFGGYVKVSKPEPKKEEAAEAVAVKVTAPRPCVLDPEPPQKPPRGWEALAEALGVATREDPQTRRISFERLLVKLGCKSWPLAGVEAWLASKAEDWAWLGLRVGQPESANGKVYGSLVPLEVLKLVSEIIEGYSETRFYISTPEPYLKVVLDGALPYVVAHWEQPGFGG